VIATPFARPPAALRALFAGVLLAAFVLTPVRPAAANPAPGRAEAAAASPAPHAWPGSESGATAEPDSALDIELDISAGTAPEAAPEAESEAESEAASEAATGTASGTAPEAGEEAAPAAAPKITAKAAYLVDASAGTELYAKNPDRRLPVASLTKVMTALVVLEEGSPDDMIKITKGDVRHAVRNGASRAGLRAGERFTAKELLYALMLPSGADAARALARRYGPGVPNFVAKMNRLAEDLGLERTHYTNPDGLPSPDLGGRSTAREQTRLAMIALSDPVLYEIASTARHSLPKTTTHRAYTWHNSNPLLTRVPGAFGLKTGFTRSAGYCLSFAAEQDGRFLFGTVLGEATAANRLRSVTRLLDLART
jgi:D-alanyl-D-alanine carboxypeptidase (penicillin-binding protein 5/6)